MKKLTKFIAVLMAACMLFSLTACGSGGTGDSTPTPTPTPGGSNAGDPSAGGETTPAPTGTETTPAPTAAPTPAGEVITIRYGTHWINGLDPHYTDEVTGEYVMDAELREARYAAEKAILDAYNVEFEYIQYSGDTREVLLQSVMANDPICDIAVIWGGAEAAVLSQNVLQKLDDYAYIFEDEDYSWMFLDKIYGGHYFLSDVVRYNQRWPLIYNIDLIEEAGLENPSVTFTKGEWTWSKFKELLTNLNAFYANDDTVSPYLTNHCFSVLSAVYAAGGAIYGGDGLAVTSDATKKGVAYIKELIDAGLLTEDGPEFGVNGNPNWTNTCDSFREGQSCFTDHADWLIGWSGGVAAERDESIGIVPWPRPDDMALEDEDYKQVITLGDTLGVLKGVDPETTELALKAWALYTKVYYTTLASVETMAEYKDAYIAQQATDFGIDIFHEEYGDAILEGFSYIAANIDNGADFSDIVGVRGVFDELVGKSLYGVDGVASYDVAIEANLNQFSEKVAEMEALIASGNLNDTTAPSVSTLKEPVAVPAGTKMTDAIWAEYLQANDSIEGILPMSSFEPEFNSADTDSQLKQHDPEAVYTEATLENVGYYYRMFKAYFTDSFGNRGYKTISVYVYDPENKEAPVITAHEEPMLVALNADVNSLSWIGTAYNAAIESVVDADGLDISGNLTADLSNLDSSTPGTYDVEITATDYAGNTASVIVKVMVE